MVKRILVIDDYADVRKLFKRALEDTPYKVETASSGWSGIDMQREVKYDLIFLDLNMPGMSGIEVLREIRRTDMEVPIYIITAFYEDFFEEISSILEEGLKFEIALKPIYIKEIVSIAEKIFEDSEEYQK
jgi:two-component system response regulator (stage 0 sporulation protein F)